MTTKVAVVKVSGDMMHKHTMLFLLSITSGVFL